MRIMKILALSGLVVGVLASCGPVVQGGPPVQPGAQWPSPAPARPGSEQSFVAVISRMEPAVERECYERRTQPINCDFLFVVDDRPELEPNAFQTLDRNGRPIIGFTLSLIAEARNADEIAFVVGHEASHHILNHLSAKSSAAATGAIILGGLASMSGASADSVRAAQNMGANFGARYYSKGWELEADYLGAIIALTAGYDPIHGAEFFLRIPDPGDQVLGSHPSSASRMAQVNRAVRDVAEGRAR